MRSIKWPAAGAKAQRGRGKVQACVKAQNEDAVRASMKEADGLGVNATPTLFINGQKIDGAVPVRAAGRAGHRT